jgi:hypothetical protein
VFDPFYSCEEADDDIILDYYDGYYVLESGKTGEIFEAYAISYNDKNNSWAFWGTC